MRARTHARTQPHAGASALPLPPARIRIFRSSYARAVSAIADDREHVRRSREPIWRGHCRRARHPERDRRPCAQALSGGRGGDSATGYSRVLYGYSQVLTGALRVRMTVTRGDALDRSCAALRYACDFAPTLCLERRAFAHGSTLSAPRGNPVPHGSTLSAPREYSECPRGYSECPKGVL